MVLLDAATSFRGSQPNVETHRTARVRSHNPAPLDVYVSHPAKTADNAIVESMERRNTGSHIDGYGIKAFMYANVEVGIGAPNGVDGYQQEHKS